MSLLSTLFGGQQTTTTKATPWGPQGSALQNIFDQAQSLYNQKAGTPWYTGPLYAGLDPLSLSGISGVNDYATGAGADASSQVGGTSSDLLSGSAENFLRSIGALGGMAGMDPTAGNIADAQLYMNNPALNSQIDAIGHDISRNLNENTLPAIDRQAVGDGNINSSRTGIAEGIAQRGAQQTLADAAAQLRGNAYEQGLSAAERARESNMGALGDVSRLYGSGVSTGLTGAAEGQDMTLNDLNAMIQAGQLKQQDQQGQYNADLERWLQNDSRGQDLLNNWFNIVGSRNWGGNQTQTTSGGGAGLLGDLLGVASVGAGLFGAGGAFPGAFGLFGGGSSGGGGGDPLALYSMFG